MIEKIIYGSGDSLDIDVAYIFGEKPSMQECKKFCSDKMENRNIVVIKNGEVIDSFKGTYDEMNNAIFNTFDLHEQILDSNPITKLIERDKAIKSIRTIRGILSQLSRTQYRTDIKRALKSTNFKERLEVLETIKLSNIKDFVKDSRVETFKFLSFQLGQTMGLLEDREFYTKQDVASYYKDLKTHLYREDSSDIYYLEHMLQMFINTCNNFDIEVNGDLTFFKDFGKTLNIKEEIYTQKR